MYQTLIIETFFQQILLHIITYFHTLSYTPLTKTDYFIYYFIIIRDYFIIKIK